MWKGRAQEVEMPTKERKKEGRSGTAVKDMGEGKGAQ